MPARRRPHVRHTQHSRRHSGIHRDADDRSARRQERARSRDREECRRRSRRWRPTPRCGVLIITGAGEAAFVSGADINDIRARGRDEGWRRSTRRSSPKSSGFRGRRSPRSTATRSAAAASWRWPATSASRPTPRSSASRSSGSASFPAPAPPSGCPASSGMGRAKHLILTGDIIDAKQALEIGLVTPSRRPDSCRSGARELAKKILRQGPLAARLAKLALNASARVDLDSGLPDRDAGPGALLQLRRQARRHDGVSREAQAEVHRTVTAD